MWLDLTPERSETQRERDLMLTLRDVLAAIPVSVTEADLISAKRAIKGMVKYAESPEAITNRVLGASWSRKYRRQRLSS